MGMYMRGHPLGKPCPPIGEYAFWVSSHAQGYHPPEIPHVKKKFKKTSKIQKNFRNS